MRGVLVTVRSSILDRRPKPTMYRYHPIHEEFEKIIFNTVKRPKMRLVYNNGIAPKRYKYIYLQLKMNVKNQFAHERGCRQAN